jgi:hypothetical protein
MGGFFDSVKSALTGFATGGVAGAVVGGLSASAEERAKEKINQQNRTLQNITQAQFDTQKRQAGENITGDIQALEEGLAGRGITDSTMAREQRLALKRDAENRLAALEGAEARYRAGEKIQDIQGDLDTAMRRYGYLGQGIQQGMALAAGAVQGAGATGATGMNAAGGATAGTSMGRALASSPYFGMSALGNTPQTAQYTPPSQQSGLGSSVLNMKRNIFGR